MKMDVVVGALYGDEGKGKIVSYLAQQNAYKYIFRVNASTNASHTVQLDNSNQVVVTKQLPSTFMNDKVEFVIAPGAILNLSALKEELLERPDITYIKGKVKIASNIVLLIKPYIEANKSSAIAKSLGSTNQGTGVAVVARTQRHCIRLYDVCNVIENRASMDELSEKIKNTCMQINKEVYDLKENEYFYNIADELIKDYYAIKNMIGNFSVDYTNFIANLKQEDDILIEGCNGILLDNIHGLHPYTTSSSTSINALMNGANLSPYLLRKSYIVCGAYNCCLNKRPFLTELSDEEIKKIHKYNNEIDNAEGMTRRVGWLDLPALRKALAGHFMCELIINKLDILQDFKEIKVCTHYILEDGTKTKYMPDNLKLVEKAKPVYLSLDGWGNIEGIKEYSNLPQTLKKYIELIESETGAVIRYLGVGRKISDVIKKDS